VIQKAKLPLIVFNVILISIIGYIIAGVVFYPKDEDTMNLAALKKIDNQLPEASESAKKPAENKLKGSDNNGEVVGADDTNVTPKQKDSSKKTSSQKSTTNQTNTQSSNTKMVTPGPVKKGQLIAYQGITGCIGGSHLVFAVNLNGVMVDPKPYLDSGEFQWPLNNPVVIEWFGSVLVDPKSSFIRVREYKGAPIYAAADGILTRGIDSSTCSSPPGATLGQGVIINHGNGLKSIYWHVQAFD
jgi:hypothetical protein